MKKPSEALIAKWDKKLAKAGFDDIEQRDNKERLKKWHSHYIQARFTPEEYEERRRYFELATHWLNNGTFENGRAKKAWELHTEGLSYREIAKVMRTNKDKINTWINQSQQESGLRKNDTD